MDCAPTGRSSLRLRAIRALYEGIGRDVVEVFCKVSERTLLYWIERFNQQGIDGLISKRGGGRPRKIERAKVQTTLLKLVDNPKEANETHWTGRKLHGYLKEELKMEVGYTTLLRYLHQENYALRFPRRWPENHDEELRSAFLTQLESWSKDPEVELWFGDECGVEGDPRPRRRWVKRGSHPRIPYKGTHLRASILGAVCPASGQLVSTLFDHCQTETFQGLLDTLEAAAAPMVRLWMTMFNEGGIDALASKPIPGRPRKLKLKKLQDILVPVLENPAQAGELHWTGVKLHGWLKESLSLELGYSTLVRYLHDLRYNLRVPRPWPERQNEEARAAFLEEIRHLQEQPQVELWFADESGVEGDPRPRRRWSARGSRPKVAYLGTHIRTNVIGAVCPANGQCFTMIYNGVDTDVFEHYLDQLALAIPADAAKQRILIVDNASWHKSNRLNWHHFGFNAEVPALDAGEAAF